MTWLKDLIIGEEFGDDPDGPFTLSECAIGQALFEHTMSDRKCVAREKFGGHYDWSFISVEQKFGWYNAARELLRRAQSCLE